MLTTALTLLQEIPTSQRDEYLTPA